MAARKNKNGFAILLAILLILVAGLVILLSAAYVGLNSIKMTRNMIYSFKSFYIAEAGIEDSLLRISKEMAFSQTNNLPLGQGNATIEISDEVGGERTIISVGNLFNRVRKIKAVYGITTDAISFHYGAQAGDGGIEMGNNAKIKGNVFSNGSIICDNGEADIENNAVIARNGNKIKGLKIKENAMTHSCEDSEIEKDLTYVFGGTLSNCDVHGDIFVQPNEIEPEDLPISSDLINDWKQQAAAGGVIYNDLTYNKGSYTLGPIQIGTPSQPRNLTLNNHAELQLTGTIYVTGNIFLEPDSVMELNSETYGPLSGVVIADGLINVKNKANLKGSGSENSYILILSTNSSLSELNPAIFVGNNAKGAIFYTTLGLLYLNNNMEIREATGYKIKINNSAEIDYESGLENAIFSSGPGGSRKLTEWREIE